ncbi:MAG: hypothetical protein R3C05_03640 [Pirellulaceae bacterium]
MKLSHQSIRVIKPPSDGFMSVIHFPRRRGEGQRLVWRTLAIVLISQLFFQKYLFSQIQESFDGGAPAWLLERNDCNAQIVSQQRITTGGRDSGPCESLAIQAGNGSRAELVYRIRPAELIDELTATLWYWSVRPGAGFRCAFAFPSLLILKPTSPPSR